MPRPPPAPVLRATPDALHTSRRAGVWVVPAAEPELIPGLEALHLSAVPRAYAHGALVHRRQDPADGLFQVLRGKVKLSVPATSMGERVIAVAGPGDLFGTSRCSGAPEHASQAVSLEDGTLVVHLSCAALGDAVRARPEVALALIRALSARIGQLEDQAEHARLPVQARLAHTLLSLARRLGREVTPDVFDLPLGLTQDELASLAGAGRIRVTQALSAWRTMGIVSGTRGTYQVDAARLGALLELLESDELA